MEDQPTTNSTSSKKPVIIAVVLALLLVGGGAAYYFYNKDKDNDQQASTENTSQTTPQPEASANTFAPASTSGKPFVATINSTVNGKDVKGVMSSDGQGNVKYAYTNGGTEVTLIYTADAYYLCNGSATCIKYPIAQSSGSGFDPSTYQYDSSRINALKDSANYKGQQACPAPSTGTCDVWSTAVGSGTSTIYVNAASKQIAKVTNVSGTTSTDVTYEYKNVTVAAPTNSVTVPTTGQ